MKKTGRTRLLSMFMAVVMVLGAMPANAVMAEEDEIVVISEEPETTAAEGGDSAEAYSDYTEPVETIEPEYTEPAEVEVYEPDYSEPVEVEVFEPDYQEPAEDSESYGDPSGDDAAGEVYIEDDGIVIESIETVEEEDIPVIEETDIAETETEDDYGIMTLDGEVAQIGNTKYSSVQDAIDDAGTAASTVTMLANSTENITIASNQDITLDLNGFTLYGYGVVSVVTIDGTLTLKDSVGTGEITNGYKSEGGGVYTSGKFIMEAGTISGNTGLTNGAGVYVNGGTFTMNGGEISGNSTELRGGGVYVNYGTFIMTEGTISNNRVANSNSPYFGGAGVYLNSGTFSMSGGTITGNYTTSSIKGAGVYVYGGTFNLSGTPVITDNRYSNVYLLNGKCITLDGELTEGASIGVTTTTAPSSSTSVQVTIAESDTEYYKKSANYFFYDEDTTKIGFPNDSKHYVEFNGTAAASLTTESYGTVKYTSVQKAIDAAETEAGTVALLTDCTENITIDSDQNIVLDLSGYTLSKSGTADSPVIDNSGTLTMQDSGGSGMIKGGYVSNAGTFTMNSGTIGSSTASESGGGVYNTGEFTMTGGEISGNIASGSGGGVYNAEVFTMTGGEISGNTAGETGGGVYNTGEFTMTGGEISGNTAGSYGGGVYTDSGIFMMTGGTISENAVGKYYGDGVYVAGGTFNLSGTPVVAGNMDSNVYLPEGIYITLTGELKAGASISVTTANAPSVDTPVQITTAEDSTEFYLSSAQYFFNGKDETNVGHANSEGKYVEIFGAEVVNVASLTTTGGEVSEYETVQAAIDAAGIGDTVALLTDASENVAIAEGKDIILDLNGYTLSGVASAAVPVVENSGTMVLQNSGSSGRINGGVSSQGGGVYNTGTFTMKSGTISGNEADYGGGVYNIGTFAMTGGTINTNEGDYGGGVYNTGTLAMTGGTINANEADYGGGVYNTGTFTMTGGTISGNTAYTLGGGVYADSGIFNLSGTPVIINNSASNVYLPNGIYITLSGELTEGASVGVTTYTAPTSSTGVQVTTVESDTEYYETSAQYFIYDGNSSYTGLAFSYGKFVVFGSTNFVALLTSEYTNGMGFSTVQKAIDAAGTTPGTVTMLANSTENITIASGQDITLDLNGYTLSGYGTAVHTVVTINGTLTLKDSEGTGKITKGNKSQGGGVYTSGSFIMENGTISGNTALTYGAGVYVNSGTFTMNGGEISGNSANSKGGGVYVNSGTFIMTEGTISNNRVASTSTNYGGAGIYLYSGTFSMSGGTITGNYTTSGNNGAGVFVYGGTFNLSGKSVITDNTYSNVYLPSGKYITLDGELTEGASIGVTPATAPSISKGVQITKAESDTEYYKTSAQYFTYDGDSDYVGSADYRNHYVELGSRYVASLTASGNVTYYETVQDAINAANDATGTVTMYRDSAENIMIDSGQDITLDLAGHVLSGAGGGSVITNKGSLTLNDSKSSGIISGGNASDGGGVYNEGTFTMNAGTISENEASGNGGGVYNEGTFTMNAGMISENEASGNGGGVYNEGTFTMNAVTISENEASNGGGVYNAGIFTMSGGTITGNKAGTAGGAVYDNGTFNLSGESVITDNTVNDEPNNVYLPSGLFINLLGKLELQSVVGVTTEVVPSEAAPVQITSAETATQYYVTSAQYFVYDGDSDGYCKGHANDEMGYVELAGILYVAELTVDEETKLFVLVQDAVNAAEDSAGTVVMLANSFENVVIGEEQNITLDLAGSALCAAQDDSTIINYGSLTLTDSSDEKTGMITQGSATNGGGVYNEGTFIMEEGTISSNTASSMGGGVYNAGTFTMNGGMISDNEQTSSSDGGGGVYNAGTFTMNYGIISSNISQRRGSGVYNLGGALFTMKDGQISENGKSASGLSYGGGIYNGADAVFIMEGGIVTGNKSNSGGGVFNNGGGFFTMSGGSIESNSANYGGGVDLDIGYGNFTMTGGTIRNNTASSKGGGLNCYGTVELILSGSPVISGNTISGSSNNVYLPSGQYITLGGEMDGDAKIGVNLQNGMGAVTTEETDSSYYSDSAEYFESDEGYPVTTSDHNKCVTFGYEITYEANDSTGTSATVYYRDEETTVGYDFSAQYGICYIPAWTTEADGSGTEYEDGCTVHLTGSMVLYAQWVAHDFSEDGFCTYCGFYEPADWDGNAYEIGNLGQFYWFASLVGNDKTLAQFTSDDTDRGASANGTLTADIGSEEKPVTKNVTSTYKGSFDGQFHTITLDLDGGTSENTALFANTNGASICNLFTAGTVKAGGKYAAGIVSKVDGNFTMEKCISSVDIISSVDGDGTHGGLAANLTSGSSFTIEDCAFTGSITGESTIKCGGIVGWANDNASGTVKDCWTTGTFDLSSSDTDSANIIRNGDSKYSNCYYLYPIRSGSEQGIQKDVDAFASGEVAWLLNGGVLDEEGKIEDAAVTDGSQAWFQNLDNDQTPDGTPVLFTSHGTVYCGYQDCEAETVSFSNEELLSSSGHNYSLEQDTDGDYLYVTFTWPEENNDKDHLDDITCTATFTCTDCGEKRDFTCKVEHISDNDHAASCTEPDDYDVRATATITNPRDGSELTAVEEEIIYGVKLGHEWDPSADDTEVNWTGSDEEGYTNCTAVLTCQRGCGATLTIPCEVTREITKASCTQDGVIVYTASGSASDDNGGEAVEFTASRTVTIPAMGSVEAEGYSGAYDGKEHGITVKVALNDSVTEGYTIAYSTAEDGDYTEENPTFSNVGEYTVYYKVSKELYEDVTGLAVVEIVKAEPEYDLPANLTAVYGDTLADVKLPEGFAWEAEESTSVGSAGEQSFTVTYTPEDTDNYEIVTGITVAVQVAAKEITEEMFTVDLSEETYNGLAHTKEISGSDTAAGVDFMVEGTDYDVNYEDNINAGTATITITGIGNYTGTLTYTFEIEPQVITEDQFDVDTGDETYSGSKITKEILSNLTEGEDYTVSYENNINAGMATITITGLGNYSGTLTYTFTISKATYDMSGVRFADATYTYNKEEHTLTISGELPEGVTVTYTDNTRTDVGSQTATASFTGDADNYEPIDSKTATLTILEATFVDGEVTGEGYDGTYDGQAHSITISLTGDAEGATITYSTSEGGEYTEDNPAYTDAGIYTVYYQVSKANYTDVTGSLTVKITEKTITEKMFTVNTEAVTYTGEAFTKEISAADEDAGNDPMTENTDYEVSYADNTNAGTATITITGIGNYTGTLTYTFVIEKAAQDISYNVTSITKLETAKTFINELTQTFISPEEGSGVTYSSSDETIAIVNEETGEVNIDGTGKVTITATAAATENYAEASASYELTVIEPEETVTADVEDHPYDGNEIHLYARIEHDMDGEAEGLTYSYQWYRNGELIEGETGEILTLSGDDVAAQEGTIYTCVITIRDEYFFDEVKASFTVTILQAENSLTITTKSLDKTYDGRAVAEPEVTADFGEDTVTFTWYEVAENGAVIAELDQAPSDAGTYKVVASVPETNNYAGASDELTFTIAPLEITEDQFDVDTGDETYSGSKITKEIRSDLTEGTDYTVFYENNTNAGTAKITIAGTGNYTGTQTYTFTIQKASFGSRDVSAAGYSGTYDGEAHSITVTLSGKAEGAKVTYSTEKDGSYTEKNPAYTKAGTYTVYYKVSKTNYTEVTGSETVEIVQAPVSTATTTALLMLKGEAAKKSVTLSWNKVKNADGYIIYGAKCGKKIKEIATVEGRKNTTYKVKGLKKSTRYKFRVLAYKTVNGEQKTLKKSNMVHVVTASKKYTNVKSVKVSRKEVNLRLGRTTTITASYKLAETGKKLPGHMAYIHYVSSDKSVATVNKKGRITAVGKGTCKIYAYAADGSRKKITVTVK